MQRLTAAISLVRTVVAVGACCLKVAALPVSVTVEQAPTQDDPTNDVPIEFVATFSEPVIGFNEADVSISGPTGGGVSSVTEDAPFDGTVFAIRVGGTTQDGTVVVTIPADVVENGNGEPNTASTSKDNVVLFDASPPPPPSSRLPRDGQALSDVSPALTWEAAVDPGGSGVKNYRVLIEGTFYRSYYTSSTSYAPELGEGVITWKINTRDHAGNTGGWSPYWQLTIDGTAPTNPTLSSASHSPGVWSSDTRVEVASAGASDLLSGVAGFDVTWDQSAASTASGSITHPDAWTGGAFDATVDGEWWIHLSTADRAGNYSGPIQLGPFLIDTTAPVIDDVPDTIALDAEPGAEAAIVVWSEPTPADAASGVAGFASTHRPGDHFPVGTTTVTYTASDRLDHARSASFYVLVNPNPVTQFLPSGAGGDDAFFDRPPPLRPDGEPLIVGALPLAAVYEAGEVALGRFALLARNGGRCANAHPVLTLHAVALGEAIEKRVPIRTIVLTYDHLQGAYPFEIATDDLLPGYYDVQLRYRAGCSQWLRIQMVPPAD